MKKFLKSKKGLALLGAIIAAVAVAVGAYAYFTTTGSGQGNATVGHDTPFVFSNVTVGDLYPGGPAVPVTVDTQNTSPGDQYLGAITGTVEDNGLCLGSWFTVAPIAAYGDVAPGAFVHQGTTITFNNLTTTDQSACKDKTLTIDWAS